MHIAYQIVYNIMYQILYPLVISKSPYSHTQ